MKTKIILIIVTVLLGIAIVPLTLAREPQNHTGAPGLDGTYKLIMRQLPDGTKQTTPDVIGLLTFTKKHRNFNVVWKDANGKFYSYSVVSTYKLTATEYIETMLFSMLNDQINGKQISYDLTGQRRTAPVVMKDGKIEFKMPFDSSTIIIDGNWITTKVEGMFTDYWERVD